MAEAALRQEAVRHITLPALFVGLLKVSMCGFGGPVVWARRFLVERYGWLDDPEFAEILGLCQFLPGPNMVSVAVCVGSRFRGLPGALAALCGFTVIPCSLGFVLGALLLRHAHAGVLPGALRGVAAAAAGLMIGTGLRMLAAHRGGLTAMLFAPLAFAGLALLKLPLLLVLLVLLPLSVAAAHRQAAPA